MSDFVLNRLENLAERVKALEAHVHEPGYHEHLLDHEEHIAHHATLDKPKDKRVGEQRKGERRTSTEKYEGEERRA